MNNLYRSIKMAAFAMVAVLGLVGCQQKEDLFGLEAQIAEKSLQGFYAYVDVDLENMTTTLYEWKFEDGAAGKVGYYRVVATGNGVDQNGAEDSLTWEAPIYSEDKLSMTIPVTLKGEKKELIWSDGVITVDGYTTTKYVISMANVLRAVNDNFANVTYVINDTTWVIEELVDSVYFLSWKTQVTNLTQDSIDAYKQYLLTMKDTIAWFNKNYPTSKVPDTIRVAPKQQADGTYKVVVPVATEDMAIELDTIVYGPSQIVDAELVMNRTEKENTGSYSFRMQTFTDDFYHNPEEKTAQSYDSLYVLKDVIWTPVSFSNNKKFVVMATGNQNIEVKAQQAGTSTKDEKDEKEDVVKSLSISNFSTAGEGTLDLEGYSYELKK